jgi:hypothetical protein
MFKYINNPTFRVKGYNLELLLHFNKAYYLHFTNTFYNAVDFRVLNYTGILLESKILCIWQTPRSLTSC